MTAIAKKSIQVYLRPEQVEALQALAQRRNLPISALIRQQVDRLLGEDTDPLYDIIGIVASGPGDLAEQHDEYLCRMIQEENQ